MAPENNPKMKRFSSYLTSPRGRAYPQSKRHVGVEIRLCFYTLFHAYTPYEYGEYDKSE